MKYIKVLFRQYTQAIVLRIYHLYWKCIATFIP